MFKKFVPPPSANSNAHMTTVTNQNYRMYTNASNHKSIPLELNGIGTEYITSNHGILYVRQASGKFHGAHETHMFFKMFFVTDIAFTFFIGCNIYKTFENPGRYINKQY